MVARLHAIDGGRHEPPLTEVLEAATGSTFVEGNAVDVLRNGDEIFSAMLRAIEEADPYVDSLTYVYWEGEIARRFARALADCAGSGVEVRVLLDGFGAATMDRRLVDELARAVSRRAVGPARVLSMRSTASVGWSDVATGTSTMVPPRRGVGGAPLPSPALRTAPGRPVRPSNPRCHRGPTLRGHAQRARPLFHEAMASPEFKED